MRQTGGDGSFFLRLTDGALTADEDKQEARAWDFRYEVRAFCRPLRLDARLERGYELGSQAEGLVFNCRARWRSVAKVQKTGEPSSPPGSNLTRGA